MVLVVIDLVVLLQKVAILQLSKKKMGTLMRVASCTIDMVHIWVNMNGIEDKLKRLEAYL